MPGQRGVTPSAIITSTIVMVLCSVGWGALGALSIAEPDALPIATHRFLCILLATVTICAVVVNLFARLMRDIRTVPIDGGYAAGYTDGLDAQPIAPVSPAVSRLVPSRR